MIEAQPKIRILVAESVDLIRMGLRMLFENHPVISLVEDTCNIADLPDLTAKHRPDVILMDVGSGDAQCAEHVFRITNIHPHSKILFFSPFHPGYLQSYKLPPGVSGIVSKYSSCKELVAAICAIPTNRLWVDLTKPIPLPISQPSKLVVNPPSLPCEISASLLPGLNNNERRVAHLARKGLSAREISQHLLLSEKTVRNYLSAIYKKMGVKKQVELCLQAPLHHHPHK